MNSPWKSHEIPPWNPHEFNQPVEESADAPAQAESGEPQREPGRPSGDDIKRGFTMGLQWVYNGCIVVLYRDRMDFWFYNGL